MDSCEELLQIADALERLTSEGQREEVQRPLEDLKRAAEDVERAWSGSWFGYQANVYYSHLQPPPSGAYFSLEWGLSNPVFDRGTLGDWVEYDREEVEERIHVLAGDPDLKPANEFKEKASTELHKCKWTILSIVELELGGPGASFVFDMKERVVNLSPLTEADFLGVWKPEQIATRDRRASLEGGKVPPHFTILAKIGVIQSTLHTVREFGEVTRQLANHFNRRGIQKGRAASRHGRVFIGHGRSVIWRELKDFLESRLGLQVDEFNRVPSAGRTTTERLSAMMDSADMALLVMTGEDEQSDRKVRARENVVHEVGLFQGRLGFERAIVLLEDGCEEFSNITGLGQIRFPKGKIKAAFEEIREVLEREDVIRR